MSSQKPTAIVYVDGLNLYRQKLAQHPEQKWLDLLALCEYLLPTHEIIFVRYFTSEVNPQGIPQSPASRQRLYWRALRTHKNRIIFHIGKMQTRERLYAVAPKRFDEKGNIVLQKVRKTEEKGSDTALAAYMVLDAATKAADLLVLLSSDSDFEPVLKLINDELRMATGLFSPTEVPSGSLLRTGPLFVKLIRKSVLEASQFNEELEDSGGKFMRPDAWKKQSPLT